LTASLRKRPTWPRENADEKASSRLQDIFTLD
jgi:hypothetical protein